MDAPGLQRGQNSTFDINMLLPTTGTPVNGVASQGTLTIAEPVTAEDTMTIGTTVYTFKAEGTAAEEGEIDLGANEAATKLNIVEALLADGGNNAIPNPFVTPAAAFVGDDLVLTAVGGVAGNAIAITETFTHADNVFDADVLGTTTAGVDGTIAIAGEQMIDASYLYISIDTSLVSTANWRRVSLGSAY